MRSNTHRTVLALLALVTLFLAGCAEPGPRYQAQGDPAPSLNTTTAARVGVITALPGESGSWRLHIRGQALRSPNGLHFGDYLADALRSELRHAGRYDATSGTEITGTLLKNQLDSTASTQANGAMEARFTVTQAGQIRFDKTKSVTYQWPVPDDTRTQQGYVTMTQSLLASLLADPDFAAALSPQP